MARFHVTVPVDDYVLDVLLRDIVGHDRQPAAYLVYLFLYGRAVRQRWQPVAAGLGAIAAETGLSWARRETVPSPSSARPRMTSERRGL